MKVSLTIAGMGLIAAAVLLTNLIAGLIVAGVLTLVFVELLEGETWGGLWRIVATQARRIPKPRRRPPIFRTALAEAIGRAATRGDRQ